MKLAVRDRPGAGVRNVTSVQQACPVHRRREPPRDRQGAWLRVDYKRLLNEFQSWGTLVRACYYTTIIEDQESSIRPLVDWLTYNGYSVVTKPAKEFVDATGRRKIRGSMEVELAVHAMELAAHIDHLVLFAGDGDFRVLAEAVQRRGVRFTVASTIASQPAMVADELRRQADEFIDVVELQPFIARDHARTPRATRPAPILAAACAARELNELA
jgi:uncharacterized LabA/DUF88 family protein